jgi:hypothetical protein
VEVSSNASIVALRVAGGDEKGTQCLGYPDPGGCKYGAWPSRLEESRI